VPEGFKGKYRVEVEGDFGPFEIARSESGDLRYG